MPVGQLEPPCLHMSPVQQVHPFAGSPGFGLDMVVNNLYRTAPPPSGPMSAATPVSSARRQRVGVLVGEHGVLVGHSSAV
ncbi:hypothetical protein ACP70R_026595 [Stipagrostis hirtigluma subsp. patula]